MPLYKNDQILYTTIISALKKVTNPEMWTTVDPVTGVGITSNLFPFNADDLNVKYKVANPDFETVRVSDYTGAGVPTSPTFETPYNTTQFTGSEATMEILAKEILNYIISQADVAMKTRMDKLETDFNALSDALTTVATELSALTTLAATIATPPTGGSHHTHVNPPTTDPVTGLPVLDVTGTVRVVGPEELSAMFTTLATATSGPSRKTTITDPLIASNEVLEGLPVQIK